MTTIRELGDHFPGSWSNKKAVKLHLKQNRTTIYYEDGSEIILEDPIQVQDFPVPKELINTWFKALRDADSSITREAFRERSYLQSTLEKVQKTE